ncbi:hypothetical protein U9M48_040208 [Paspalum notatum var. saurae]|uniref:Uncharacterized protein n=1 Tax=Paspalum notatum var. saurae TaxID=547442 RepID=A0AAQ3XFC0_PASNO
MRGFLKGHPPVFTHSADPMDAEDWLRAVERELDVAQRGFSTVLTSYEVPLNNGGNHTAWLIITPTPSPGRSSHRDSERTTFQLV